MPGWALCLVACLGACDGSSGSSRVPTSDGRILGSGREATEARPVSAFQGVTLIGEGRVQITQGGAESLTITADDNILPLLAVDVVGGDLVLSVDGNADIEPIRPIVFEVTLPELRSMRLVGAGSFEAAGVDTNRLVVELTGVGDMSAAGRVDLQQITLTGVGNYSAPELRSFRTVVDLDGVGTATVRVRDRLSGVVALTSTLEYWGDPVVDITGDGTVNHLGPF